jgi:hypothetical protein
MFMDEDNDQAKGICTMPDSNCSAHPLNANCCRLSAVFSNLSRKSFKSMLSLSQLIWNQSGEAGTLKRDTDRAHTIQRLT